MRIAMITAGLADSHAGTTHVVVSLARRLASLGATVVVHSAETNLSAALPDVSPATLWPTPFYSIGAHKLYAPGIGKALRRMPADYIHVHGFWLHPFIVGCLAGAETNGRVLLSPHGMFSRYSFSAKGGRKRLALWLGLDRALRSVDAFHATSRAEVDEIRQLGLSQPVHLLPNGVDVPVLKGTKASGGQRTLLFLSRVNPKKGLINLLVAWEVLAQIRLDWRLVIAGPDDGGHQRELERFVSARRLPRIAFVGPRYGADKDLMMQQADLFILPSLDENFGLVVAEALANGTPVLTTTRTPWAEISNFGCGWCVEPTVGAITEALTAATRYDPITLAEMGLRGRSYVGANYAWDEIARRFTREVYLKPDGSGQGERRPRP